MIDLLEPRRLFTAVTTAETALAADALSARADLAAVVAAAKVEAKAVAADLKSLPKTKENKGLIKSTLVAEANATKVLTNGIKKVIAVETVKLKQLAVDALAVLKHPTNTKAKAKLTALLSTISADVQAPVLTLGIAGYTAISNVAASFSAIELANTDDTQLPSDINTDGAAVTTALNKLKTDAQTFQSDLTTLIAAF